MASSDIMSWVPNLHKRVVSVGLHTVNLHSHLVFWMFVSLFATLSSIPVKSYDEFKSRKNFHFEDPTFFLLNSGVIFHFFSIRRQHKNMTSLTEFLIKPFKSYPTGSPQLNVIRKYYRNFAISWILMGANLFLCIFGQCMSSLVTVIWFSEGVDYKEWPIPLGRLVVLWDNELVYWFWYCVSVSSLLTCGVIHSCWFGTFMCSTLLVATKLELLALEMDSLNHRVENTCKESLNYFKSLAKNQFIRNKVCFRMTKLFIREVVDENVRIIYQVRLLDETYRWIILVYIEITVLASALVITITISEWNSDNNKGFLRLDLLFACLFFSFINNLCGQTVIDKFKQLRFSLYNVNWVNQSLTFQRSLVIMLIVNNRPPRLTAGCIFGLSLASFKKALEAIYSYINFLVTVRSLEVNPP